jgi:holo-[acyl-carrier protein] synthase
MIVGIGIDIVELGRFKKRLTPELIQELFLPDEIAYCSTQHHNEANYAARFAAKEAVFKALGAGLEQGLRWHDVEVVKEDSGAVHLQLHGRAAELASCEATDIILKNPVTHTHLSLSHSRDNAIAMVVLEHRATSPEEES